ncbi:rCG28446, partial [Rattus norvegicus]
MWLFSLQVSSSTILE